MRKLPRRDMDIALAHLGPMASATGDVQESGNLSNPCSTELRLWASFRELS